MTGEVRDDDRPEEADVVAVACKAAGAGDVAGRRGIMEGESIKKKGPSSRR